MSPQRIPWSVLDQLGPQAASEIAAYYFPSPPNILRLYVGEIDSEAMEDQGHPDEWGLRCRLEIHSHYGRRSFDFACAGRAKDPAYIPKMVRIIIHAVGQELQRRD